MLFKIDERGKMSGIISGFHETSVIAKYFVKTVNTNNVWAFRMLIFEVLAFINMICNIYFIGIFLGGEFMQYGIFLEIILKTELTQCLECFQK